MTPVCNLDLVDAWDLPPDAGRAIGSSPIALPRLAQSIENGEGSCVVHRLMGGKEDKLCRIETNFALSLLTSLTCLRLVDVCLRT